MTKNTRREKLSETGRDWKDAAADAPEPVPLPDPIDVPLERGAVLYMDPHPGGRWRWSVRWPDPREKDPLLAAGGFRTGFADSADAGMAAGKAAFAEGPRRQEAYR